LNSKIKFLYGLERFGIKKGLENIKFLLSQTENPHQNFPSIHIAGTNGKGSIAAMIASVLSSSGYRTGLYTSPHLCNFTERIRIDGKKIDEKLVSEYVKLFRPLILRKKATFFEATTAIAFKYFSDSQVDIGVIETGLGGRLDATNIIQPVLCIISNIGLDHTDILGKSISKITSEKGGIIKNGVPCITNNHNTHVLKILSKIVRSKNADLIIADRLVKVTVKNMFLTGSLLDVIIGQNEYKNIYLNLGGDYQISNMKGALAALEFLKEQNGFKKITEKSLKRGLSEIEKYTGLRGRLDVISYSPLTIVDVAHNPDGVEKTMNFLKKLIPPKSVFIFGVMKDKNYQEMLEYILPKSRVIITAHPNTSRALDPVKIISYIQQRGGKAFFGGKLSKCIEIAKKEIRSNEPLIILGSHYVAGDAFTAMGIVP